MDSGVTRGQSFLDTVAVKGVTGAVRSAVASMAAQGLPKPLKGSANKIMTAGSKFAGVWGRTI